MHYQVIEVLMDYIYVINTINIVGDNKIGDEGAITIGNALQNNTILRELYLCNIYNKYLHR
jgi:hypothetical protein